VASLLDALSAFADATLDDAAHALRSGLSSRRVKVKKAPPAPVIDVSEAAARLKRLQADVYSWPTPDIERVRTTVRELVTGNSVAQLTWLCDEVGALRKGKKTKGQLVDALAEGPIQTLRTRFRNVGT
jgi:hypothetical protein